MELQLLKAFHSTIMENERQMKAQKKEQETLPPIESKITDASALSDVGVIERAFGKLYEGKEIKTDLRTLLSLLPRKRERSDAYKGLIKDLNARGVKLEILPRLKMNQSNKESDE